MRHMSTVDEFVAESLVAYSVKRSYTVRKADHQIGDSYYWLATL